MPKVPLNNDIRPGPEQPMRDGEQLWFDLRVDSTAQTVTAVLRDMRAGLARAGHGAAEMGTWEIVLAEAMNNVVEHAYGDCPGHVMSLRASFGADRLNAVIRDTGMEMPGLRLPQGIAPEVDGPREDLPEGGFGWHMLHLLTERLEYTRIGDENRLMIEMALEP